MRPDWCLTGLSSAIACSSELGPRPTRKRVCRALCQAKRAPRAAFPSGCLAAQTKRWAEGIRVPAPLAGGGTQTTTTEPLHCSYQSLQHVEPALHNKRSHLTGKTMQQQRVAPARHSWRCISVMFKVERCFCSFEYIFPTWEK